MRAEEQSVHTHKHMESILKTLQKTRLGILLCGYSAILSACFFLAYDLRFDFAIPPEVQADRWYFLVQVLLGKLILLATFRQYGTLFTYFSIPDLIRIVCAMGLVGLTELVVWLYTKAQLAPPRGVILTDFILSVGALCAMRLTLRVYRERFAQKETPGDGKVRRVAILGGGDAGAQFVREIQSKRSLGLRPIMFLDDDQEKHGHQIHGVPVMGYPKDIVWLRNEYPVDSCVLAMPSATGRRLQDIYRSLSAEKLPVEIIPSLAELASGRIHISRIRPVQLEDLLGREAVDLRNPAVAALVQNKVVLVTGAGGSIGSELCRQLAGYNPQRLLLVEQSEGSLFTIEAELNSLGYQGVITPLVADILDLPRLRRILQDYAPHIIFHAAAHKHVYMMERQPAEAVKNNTTGTRQLAELAQAAGIGTFVFISPDKAINPTSAMGASKRLAEIHLQAVQRRPGNRTRFIAVRFGNVLGSSGSVIPIFKQQIAAGGPVTVTHPEVTRYFMTIPEAVGLVLQTSVMGLGGEIFILDMGNPVKIIDLARQLIELSGLKPDEDIEIKIIGLRPGEKLYEELQHTSENLRPTSHPRVTVLATGVTADLTGWAARCLAELEQPASELDNNSLKRAIKQLVPEYTPHLD